MSLASAIQTGDVSLLPSRRDEDWRWTDLRALIRQMPPPSPAAEVVQAGGPFAGLSKAELVLANGRMNWWPEKTVAGVDSFHGAAGLDPFLARTDILVVLLPITPETQGILDTGLFSRLKHRTPIGGPVLINAGRGGLQVESAILKP